jgi:hypothetical protein
MPTSLPPFAGADTTTAGSALNVEVSERAFASRLIGPEYPDLVVCSLLMI